MYKLNNIMVRYLFDDCKIDKTYQDIEAAFKDIFDNMRRDGYNYKDYNIYERVELADGNAFWQKRL